MLRRIIWVILLFAGIYFISDYVRTSIQEKDTSYQQQLILHEQGFTERIHEKERLVEDLQKEINKLKKKEKRYHFFVVGDIMMDRGVERVIKKLEKDYHFSFEFMKPIFEKADYVFANLEGSLSDVGRDMGSKYSFHFDLPVADALKKGGISMVSLANNHMLDWGRESVCATTKNLDRVDISFVGAGCNKKEADQEKEIQLGDTKIAIIAYSELNHWAKAGDDTPGMSEWNVVKIKKRIQELKKRSDIDLVFVSVHWGDEYKNRAPERIVVLGQDFVDAGADVVIGHHPHVDQEIERYGDGWIIYSLGNFIFDQSWSENTMEGLMADIIIQDKQVADVQSYFIDLNKYYQPVLRGDLKF